MLEGATGNDLLVSVCTAYREPAGQLAYVARLRAQRVQAVVLAGRGFEDPGYVTDMSEELARFRTAGGRRASAGTAWASTRYCRTTAEERPPWRVTAVFAFNDLMAVGTLSALRSRHRSPGRGGRGRLRRHRGCPLT